MFWPGAALPPWQASPADRGLSRPGAPTEAIPSGLALRPRHLRAHALRLPASLAPERNLHCTVHCQSRTASSNVCRTSPVFPSSACAVCPTPRRQGAVVLRVFSGGVLLPVRLPGEPGLGDAGRAGPHRRRSGAADEAPPGPGADVGHDGAGRPRIRGLRGAQGQAVGLRTDLAWAHRRGESAVDVLRRAPGVRWSPFRNGTWNLRHPAGIQTYHDQIYPRTGLRIRSL